jgi:hypothetical protein
MTPISRLLQEVTMKTKELAPKTFGPLIVVTGDVYRTITVPMTFLAYVDVASLERSRDGKVVKANTLFSATYDVHRLGDVTWETLCGDPLVKQAVDLYLEKIGIVGSLNWAPMEMQEPGRLEFRMKPHMVDMFFPELVGRAIDAGADMTVAARPRSVAPPELRLVV